MATKSVRLSLPPFKEGDLILSTKDILFPSAFGPASRVLGGEIGRISKIVKNARIQDVNPFCDDDEYEKKIGGHSTILDVLWLTGEHVGCCTATHKSTVVKILDADEVDAGFDSEPEL